MSLFLKKTPLKNGVYLQIVDGFYNPKTRNASQRVYKKLGYIEDLKKDYSDPIGFFTAEVERLNAGVKLRKAERADEEIPDVCEYKNLGYFPISRLYNELNMPKMFAGIEKLSNSSSKYSLSDVFEMLLYSRVISPSSKLATYEEKDMFFKDFSFSKDQMYKALETIGENDEVAVEYLQLQVNKLFKRNFKNVYFDCTNFYFEIDRADEFRRPGPSKEERSNPIVGMGLLLDGDGIPLSYKLYPGNCSEKPIMRDILENHKSINGINRRVIRVADKGLNCSDNIYDAIKKNDGYIYSQTVKGASKETKEWILLDSNYKSQYDKEGMLSYKIKSDIVQVELKVTNSQGVKETFKVKQKQIVFWSRNFAAKQKLERERLVAKADMLASAPALYKMNKAGNASKYIQEEYADKNTGEVLKPSQLLTVDLDKISNEERLDGYYLIVTSELNAKDEDIIDAYRSLWEIEESFRITKSQLEARPVYVSKMNSIRGHFLVCFTSLLMLRIIQKIKLKNQISCSSLIDTLRRYNCVKVSENTYMFTYKDDNLAILSQYYSTSLNKHYKKAEEIKKLLKR